MEFEKSTEKFSFGFGSVKTAGSGTIDKAVEAPKNVKTRYDKKQIAQNAAKAAVLSAAVILKHKRRAKKNK
jgi:hypothetical protein